MPPSFKFSSRSPRLQNSPNARPMYFRIPKWPHKTSYMTKCTDIILSSLTSLPKSLKRPLSVGPNQEFGPSNPYQWIGHKNFILRAKFYPQPPRIPIFNLTTPSCDPFHIANQFKIVFSYPMDTVAAARTKPLLRTQTTFYSIIISESLYCPIINVASCRKENTRLNL